MAVQHKERLRRHCDGKRGILRGSERQKTTWGHKGELRRSFEQSTDVIKGAGTDWRHPRQKTKTLF